MEAFRYSLIAATAFAVSMIVAAKIIPLLKEKQFGQFIREDGPKAHLSKAGTPTMGGLAIVAGVTVALIISLPVTGGFGAEKLMILFSMYAFGLIGFIDDYNKIAKKQNEGLTPKQKIAFQLIFGLALAVFMELREGTYVLIPFLKVNVNFGVMYIPFIVFVEVAMANAVNLTDGLDGLASSTSAIVAACFAVVGIFIIDGGNEPMASASQAIFGASVGFLIYNRYPARIFMGDTGSMALGGVLAAAAVIGHIEWLLPVAGLIFVIEAMSVIIQVVYFKKTGGRRIFRMAPIHHHFELGGWHETKVVRIFSIFTFVCCIIAVISVM